MYSRCVALQPSASILQYAAPGVRCNCPRRLCEGDFSVRARWSVHAAAMGDALTEINHFCRELQANRFHALEALALLNTVMQVIDVAIFAFDDEGRGRLVNQAAQTLLARPRERLMGHTADELGLADTLMGEADRLLDRTFPSGAGRWSMRRSPFRQDGRRHQLVVIADLSSTLREEELRMAEPRSRPQPRTQQFARADQVAGRQP